MGNISINHLTRKLQRLQDQAARNLLDHAQIEFICRWGNEDTGEREPGVTYIITDWSTGAQLEREGDQK